MPATLTNMLGLDERQSQPQGLSQMLGLGQQESSNQQINLSALANQSIAITQGDQAAQFQSDQLQQSVTNWLSNRITTSGTQGAEFYRQGALTTGWHEDWDAVAADLRQQFPQLSQDAIDAARPDFESLRTQVFHGNMYQAALEEARQQGASPAAWAHYAASMAPFTGYGHTIGMNQNITEAMQRIQGNQATQQDYRLLAFFQAYNERRAEQGDLANVGDAVANIARYATELSLTWGATTAAGTAVTTRLAQMGLVSRLGAGVAGPTLPNLAARFVGGGLTAAAAQTALSPGMIAADYSEQNLPQHGLVQTEHGPQVGFSEPERPRSGAGAVASVFGELLFERSGGPVMGLIGRALAPLARTGVGGRIAQGLQSMGLALSRVSGPQLRTVGSHLNRFLLQSRPGHAIGSMPEELLEERLTEAYHGVLGLEPVGVVQGLWENAANRLAGTPITPGNEMGNIGRMFLTELAAFSIFMGGRGAIGSVASLLQRRAQGQSLPRQGSAAWHNARAQIVAHVAAAQSQEEVDQVQPLVEHFQATPEALREDLADVQGIRPQSPGPQRPAFLTPPGQAAPPQQAAPPVQETREQFVQRIAAEQVPELQRRGLSEAEAVRRATASAEALAKTKFSEPIPPNAQLWFNSGTQFDEQGAFQARNGQTYRMESEIRGENEVVLRVVDGQGNVVGSVGFDRPAGSETWYAGNLSSSLQVSEDLKGSALGWAMYDFFDQKVGNVTHPSREDARSDAARKMWASNDSLRQKTAPPTEAAPGPAFASYGAAPAESARESVVEPVAQPVEQAEEGLSPLEAEVLKRKLRGESLRKIGREMGFSHEQARLILAGAQARQGKEVSASAEIEQEGIRRRRELQEERGAVVPGELESFQGRRRRVTSEQARMNNLQEKLDKLDREYAKEKKRGLTDEKRAEFRRRYREIQQELAPADQAAAEGSPQGEAAAGDRGAAPQAGRPVQEQLTPTQARDFVPEPQVAEIVDYLNSVGIKTTGSRGYLDAQPRRGLLATPDTLVRFEKGKIPQATLDEVRNFLSNQPGITNIRVADGEIGFSYRWGSTKAIGNVAAQNPENVRPAQEVWAGVQRIIEAAQTAPAVQEQLTPPPASRGQSAPSAQSVTNRSQAILDAINALPHSGGLVKISDLARRLGTTGPQLAGTLHELYRQKQIDLIPVGDMRNFAPGDEVHFIPGVGNERYGYVSTPLTEMANLVAEQGGPVEPNDISLSRHFSQEQHKSAVQALARQQSAPAVQEKLRPPADRLDRHTAQIGQQVILHSGPFAGRQAEITHIGYGERPYATVDVLGAKGTEGRGLSFWLEELSPAARTITAEELAREVVKPTTLEQHIINNLRGQYVLSIKELRDKMPEGQRGREFDQEVLRLHDAGIVQISVDADPARFSAAERAELIEVDGHLFTTIMKGQHFPKERRRTPRVPQPPIASLTRLEQVIRSRDRWQFEVMRDAWQRQYTEAEFGQFVQGIESRLGKLPAWKKGSPNKSGTSPQDRQHARDLAVQAEEGMLQQEINSADESAAIQSVEQATPAEQLAASAVDFPFGANEPGFGAPLTPGEQMAGRGIGPGQVGGIGVVGTEGRQPMRQMALANAKVDEDRRQAGLPALMSAARLANPEVWDQAMQLLEQNPNVGAELVDELSRQTRPTSVHENAILLHRMIALRNEYRRTSLQDAAEFDKPPALRNQAKLDRLELQGKALLAEMEKLDVVARSTGTEWGRAGQFRRQLAAEDFSLAGMLMAAQRAKRGQELTREEKAEIAALQKQIEDLQAQLAKLEESGRVQPGQPSEPGFRLEQAKAKFQRKLTVLEWRSAPWRTKAWRLSAEVFNFPRSLLAAIDFPVLRQGMANVLSHPVRTARAIPEMFAATFSEESAQRAQYNLDTRANAALYKAAGLEITRRTGPLAEREEGFLSRLIHMIPTWVPVLGQMKLVTKASERSYVTFLNRIRADSFDALASSLAKKGKLSTADAKAIAHFVNVATGRGHLGKAEKATTVLSALFFAPKWAVSRFQFLLGSPLWASPGMSAAARTAVAQEYGRVAGGLGVVIGLLILAGFDFEWDPRSADFGKLRIGNTTLDLTGGLASALRLLAQTATLSTKTSGGDVVSLRDSGTYGQQTYMDVLTRFIRGKLAPTPGAVLNVLNGTDVVGQPVTPASTAIGLTMPLFTRDVAEVMREEGVPAGTVLTLLALFGGGIQTINRERQAAWALQALPQAERDRAIGNLLIRISNPRPQRQPGQSVEQWQARVNEWQQEIQHGLGILEHLALTPEERLDLLRRTWQQRGNSLRGQAYREHIGRLRAMGI